MIPPTEPTTAPTMTGVFELSSSVLFSRESSPSLESGDSVPSAVPLGVPLVVWLRSDVLGVELPGSDEATDSDATVTPLGSSRYTVRASGGRPICSGQPMNEADGVAEGDASNTVIVAQDSSLMTQLR